MRLLFWFAAGLILYAYIGYPIWLWVRSRLRPKPVRRGSVSDSISVVMVVRDGASVLARKLQNLLELRYPTDNWNIVVVSDGSTDATNEILASYERLPRVRSILNSVSGGKAAGLNEALRHCDSDLIFFTDVRQIIEPNAFALLAENFADPSVGCVSGELMLGDMNSGESGKGIGLYWRIEKRIRELESDSGSVAGATGAIYAVRRKCIPNLPIETLLDDVFIPMAVVERGYRVVFDPRARAWDVADQGVEREFGRKVRTLSGNYQLIQLMPSVLSGRNPIRFEFVSHKLLRLCVPFALFALLLSSLFLTSPFYRVATLLQLAFYGLALLSLLRLKVGPLSRAADAVLAFVLLNTAALVAFVHFIFRRKVAWGHIAAQG
jgi:cellulose synthase/poly-beta-1,6-N-acetylglucosamine synthase-like glycosyltransferase